MSALGFDGQHCAIPDEATALRMVQQAVDSGITFFDNCWEYHRGKTFRSFEQQVLPEAARKGIAVLGMKSMGGSGEIITHGAATPSEALRYAMSLPVATTISGFDSLEVLHQNLEITRNFQPMNAEEMKALRERCRDIAADGRLELFKTTKKYDGKEGREQHHYPLDEELPV